MVKEGKVRYIGVSNYNVAQLARISAIQKPVSLQPPYSMITPDFENDLRSYCQSNNIGVVCYSPMYKGLLTGKITRERVENFAAGDHRRNDPNFNEPKFTRNLKLAEKLTVIAGDLGITPAQLSIAWVLRLPEVTSAIVGARNPSQLKETVNAGGIELPENIVTEIDELLQSL